MTQVHNALGLRPLRFVRWNATLVSRRNIYDFRQRDSWTCAGVPADARLLDVRVQPSPGLLGMPEILFIYEHDSWPLVMPGAWIPEHPVVFVDLRAAMRFFPPDDQTATGAEAG